MNQSKHFNKNAPLTIEEQILTEKIKRRDAINRAEKALRRAKAEELSYNKSIINLNKKLQSNCNMNSNPSWVAVVLSTIVTLIMGLDFIIHSDNFHSFGLPLIIVGILTSPIIYLLYKKRVRSNFPATTFGTLLLQVVMGLFLLEIF